MKLNKHVTLKADLVLKSGLHIGTGEKGHYGEPLTVMKSLATQMPFIPGSSIKGKMRFLLEISFCKLPDGKPCQCGTCSICLLFGSGSSSTTFEPSRLIFRDSLLNGNSINLLEKIDLEKKAGVRIDRATGKAADKALYALERIPEGMTFNLEMSARVFEGDDEDALKNWLAMGLYLLEQDALGGGGTRGSGHIGFENIILNGQMFGKDWRQSVIDSKDSLYKNNLIKKKL
jgi:CRISPR-associated protein Csm3